MSLAQKESKPTNFLDKWPLLTEDLQIPAFTSRLLRNADKLASQALFFRTYVLEPYKNMCTYVPSCHSLIPGYQCLAVSHVHSIFLIKYVGNFWPTNTNF